jgi:hypothetical protein
MSPAAPLSSVSHRRRDDRRERELRRAAITAPSEPETVSSELLFPDWRVGGFEENVRPGDLLGLAIRVSSRRQETDRQEGFVRDVAARAGAEVVATAVHVGNGTDPGWLTPLAEYTSWLRKRGRRAWIVAAEMDRLIRPASYDSVAAWREQAGPRGFELLARAVWGCPCLTILHPDAGPEEVDRAQEERGHWRGTLPGDNPRDRDRKLPIAWGMRREGYTFDEIQEAVDATRGSAGRWVRRAYHFGRRPNVAYTVSAPGIAAFGPHGREGEGCNKTRGHRATRHAPTTRVGSG